MHVYDKSSTDSEGNLVPGLDEATAKQRGVFDGVDGPLPFQAVDGVVTPGPTCITGLSDSRLTEHTCPECVAYYDE